MTVRIDTNSLYDWPIHENVYFVKSSGFIADRTLLASAAANGPTAPGRAPASWLAIADECPLQMTVAGRNEGVSPG